MSERWLPVPGFEGLYEVSDLGRVRSVDRVVTMRNRWGGFYERLFKGQIIAQGPHPQGYIQFHLYKDGKQHYLLAHQLVAETFIGPVPEGMQVCHNDGDRKHNHLSNLRHDTPKGNTADKKRHGTYVVGEASPVAVLTEADVKAIRAARGVPQQVLADRYGCTFSNISVVQLRKSWRHV